MINTSNKSDGVLSETRKLRIRLNSNILQVNSLIEVTCNIMGCETEWKNSALPQTLGL